jgi:hypothetical protein
LASNKKSNTPSKSQSFFQKRKVTIQKAIREEAINSASILFKYKTKLDKKGLKIDQLGMYTRYGNWRGRARIERLQMVGSRE